jgi:hypothetical protein
MALALVLRVRSLVLVLALLHPALALMLLTLLTSLFPCAELLRDLHDECDAWRCQLYGGGGFSPD